jgi:hypothetical protein
MNEDIYDEVFNVRILDNGSIIAIRTIKPGDELLTKYGNDSKSTKERGYDWDWLKEEALEALITELRSRFPMVKEIAGDISLGSLRESIRQPLHKAIHQIIHSETWHENLHSATPDPSWSGTDGLALFLSSGAVYEKYRFGGFGSGKSFPQVDISRGSLPHFTDSWNGVNTARLDSDILFKRLENVSLRQFRSDFLRYGPTANSTHHSSKTLPTISCSLGRVTVSLHTGIGKPGARRMEDIQQATDRASLLSYLRNARVWRVTIKTDTNEHKATPGKGYCGFISMDRIVNGMGRTLSPVTDEGISAMIEIIDTLVHNSKAPLRSNWKDIAHLNRSPREALAETGRFLADNRHNWLALQRLPFNQWLNGAALLDNCMKWNFSRWYTSAVVGGELMLEENQFWQ